MIHQYKVVLQERIRKIKRDNFVFASISSHPMSFSRKGPLSWIGPILKYIWFAYVGFT